MNTRFTGLRIGGRVTVVGWPTTLPGLLAAISLTGWLTAGCAGDPAGGIRGITDKATADQTRFYPLQPGRFVVYAVSQTQYRPNQSPTITTFQRKERVGGAFRDAAGQPAFRIERFRRAGESWPWLADSVFSAQWANGQLLRTQNGLTTRVLVLPVYDRSRWNPAQYAYAGSDAGRYAGSSVPANPGVSAGDEGRFYEIQNSYQPVLVGTMRFGQSLTVRQRADSTGLGQDSRHEIYALDVGVVYREVLQVRFCYAPGCIGQARIETGTRQQEQILYYGIE